MLFFKLAFVSLPDLRKLFKALTFKPPDHLEKESLQDQRTLSKTWHTSASRRNSQSTVRFNKQRQNRLCIQQQRLIGSCLRRFNALLILHSSQTAQPTQASAFILTAVSYSQAGNTKTMETARMWHSEILLSRLVSLFLNKALHGVSSAACFPSLCFSPSLSFSPFFSVYPRFFFSHWSFFIPLCSFTQPYFSPLCLCFCLFSVLFLSFLLLLRIQLQILYESLSSVFGVIAAELVVVQ